MVQTILPMCTFRHAHTFSHTHAFIVAQLSQSIKPVTYFTLESGFMWKTCFPFWGLCMLSLYILFLVYSGLDAIKYCWHTVPQMY